MFNHQNRKLSSAMFSVTAVALLVIGTPLAAQEWEAQHQEQVELTEEEIERVAEAYVEVIEVQERFGAQVQQAQDAEEAQRVQHRANDKMEEIIADHDLTVGEYNRVIQAVGANEEYREQFVAKLQRLQDEEDES